WHSRRFVSSSTQFSSCVSFSACTPSISLADGLNVSLLLSYIASQASPVSDQFAMLLGRSLLFYGLHFVALTAGLWFLTRSQYREHIERSGQTLPVVLFVSLGCLAFAISEPQREWFGDF